MQPPQQLHGLRQPPPVRQRGHLGLPVPAVSEENCLVAVHALLALVRQRGVAALVQRLAAEVGEEEEEEEEQQQQLEQPHEGEQQQQELEPQQGRGGGQQRCIGGLEDERRYAAQACYGGGKGGHPFMPRRHVRGGLDSSVDTEELLLEIAQLASSVGYDLDHDWPVALLHENEHPDWVHHIYNLSFKAT